jgi:SulP family sulfate permease
MLGGTVYQPGMASSLLYDLRTPSRLIPALSSGLVVGLLVIVIELSLATMIFSGPLAPFAPAAAGLTLFGGFLMGLVVAVGSGFRTSICLPEDAPTAIMASVAAGLAASLGAATDPRVVFATIGASMAISTFATGVLFLAMGRFGLGNLMRYIPYPVVGGFMAGIGWLLVDGGFSIVTGVSLGFSTIGELCGAENLLRMAPAFALTAALLFGMMRVRSPFVLPGVLLLAVGGFALYLALTGTSLEAAGKAGYLLGGLHEGERLWPVFGLSDLGSVRWDAIVSQLPQLLTIPLVSAISVLLIASGIETAARQDLDLNRELYVNALANLLAAPGASQAGYTALSFSLLGPKTGSDSRVAALFSSLIIGAAILFGTSLLAYFPRFVLGGMVLFLGLATLLDWAVSTRRQVALVDYCLILSILCAVAVFGFLTGVGYGLIMAMAIFVIKYSRLPVIWQQADGVVLSSRRLRSVPDQHILSTRGREIRVLRVMGYLFFGSANLIGRTATGLLSSSPGFVVFDFAETDGFDSSAVNSFHRFLQRCAASGCVAVFASAPANFQERMAQSAPVETAAARFFPDLDRALEWCEDEILASDDEAGREALFDHTVDDVLTRLERSERFEALVDRMAPYLERRAAPAGGALIRPGETPEGVLLLLSGQAEETVSEEGAAAVRLRSLAAGDMAGQADPERALPSATRLDATTDCVLAWLSWRELARLREADPVLALEFFVNYAAQLETRLTDGAPPRR